MADETSFPEPQERLRAAVREKYHLVAKDPSGHFAYPVGRESALRLGYDPAFLETVPPEVVGRFVGVGHPLSLRPPMPGERILDVGCGAGLDAFVASGLVGDGGRVTGIDLCPGMLDIARAAARAAGRANIGFEEGTVEALPFEDGSFDLVISNGALNLVPDKIRAYREIHRVLRKGGDLAAADILVVETVPESVLADPDAWST